jgi:hypothetical protein
MIGDLDIGVLDVKPEYAVWTVTEPDSMQQIQHIDYIATGQYCVLMVIVTA